MAGMAIIALSCFFFSSRRRHTRFSRDWSSDVCSSDLARVDADRARPHLRPVVHREHRLDREALEQAILDHGLGAGKPLLARLEDQHRRAVELAGFGQVTGRDRKSTRLNSSHVKISYAV